MLVQAKSRDIQSESLLANVGETKHIRLSPSHLHVELKETHDEQKSPKENEEPKGKRRAQKGKGDTPWWPNPALPICGEKLLLSPIAN